MSDNPLTPGGPVMKLNVDNVRRASEMLGKQVVVSLDDAVVVKGGCSSPIAITARRPSRTRTGR